MDACYTAADIDHPDRDGVEAVSAAGRGRASSKAEGSRTAVRAAAADSTPPASPSIPTHKIVPIGVTIVRLVNGGCCCRPESGGLAGISLGNSVFFMEAEVRVRVVTGLCDGMGVGRVDVLGRACDLAAKSLIASLTGG